MEFGLQFSLLWNMLVDYFDNRELCVRFCYGTEDFGWWKQAMRHSLRVLLVKKAGVDG